MDKGIIFENGPGRWDSLSGRIVRRYQVYRPSQTDVLSAMLAKRFSALHFDARQAGKKFAGQFSMAQLWNVSMVGAILLGMVSMSMIYRFLGPGASAQDLPAAPQPIEQTVASAPAPAVLGASVVSDASQSDVTAQVASVDVPAVSESDFDKRAKTMVGDYPIGDMLPYILDKDQTVAALMIGIAKQESGWGQHVPLLEEQDCYNYWGYREQRQLLGTGGHTCFNSRKDAVDTVAKRIKNLVGQGYNTPAKMILWKCGDSCVGDESEQRWISTVGSIYGDLMAK